MSLAGLENLRPSVFKDAYGQTRQCLTLPFKASLQDEERWITAGGPLTFEEWTEEQRNLPVLVRVLV